MIWYFLLTAAIGSTGAIARMNWIELALAGIVLHPIGAAGLMLAGDDGWTATGKTFAGLVVMQLVYVVAGWAFGRGHRREHSTAKRDKPSL